ncbi:deaminase [Kutzneria chonburiensis]|uniref:Deaminase n=1 Tax=Kutzneria chonburiensis TaxID=1483604 RepID=A0ABV6MUZ1_9PSEU|nr:deaminase [Kutzneria chonburiensis]
MTPDELVAAAMEAAEEGMTQGGLPIGAVVASGDEIVAKAYTKDSGGRLKHADLLAMLEVDGKGYQRLRLAVNLEPCLMCLGAAMSLGVKEIYYGLNSPGDGAAGIARVWQPGPGMGWYRAPEMHGGIRADEVRAQFGRYCGLAPDTPLRTWAKTLVAQP